MRASDFYIRCLESIRIRASDTKNEFSWTDVDYLLSRTWRKVLVSIKGEFQQTSNHIWHRNITHKISQILNPCHLCRAELIWGTIYPFSIISRQWAGTHREMPFSWKTGTHLSYIVSAMAADDLATQGARASVVMILTYFSQNIPILGPVRMIFLRFWFSMSIFQLQGMIQHN